MPVSAAAVFDLGNATGAAKDVTATDRQARISDLGKRGLADSFGETVLRTSLQQPNGKARCGEKMREGFCLFS